MSDPKLHTAQGGTWQPTVEYAHPETPHQRAAREVVLALATAISSDEIDSISDIAAELGKAYAAFIREAVAP